MGRTKEEKLKIVSAVEKSFAVGVRKGTTLKRLGVSKNAYAVYKKQAQNDDLESKAHRSGRKPKPLPDNTENLHEQIQKQMKKIKERAKKIQDEINETDRLISCLPSSYYPGRYHQSDFQKDS
jgi:hypothetical protein